MTGKKEGYIVDAVLNIHHIQIRNLSPDVVPPSRIAWYNKSNHLR
jgi:hypothetical protein